MIKALSLGGLSWAELGKRVWREIEEDEVFGRAAQLSYYFPARALPPCSSSPRSSASSPTRTATAPSLFTYLGSVLPGEASD